MNVLLIGDPGEMMERLRRAGGTVLPSPEPGDEPTALPDVDAARQWLAAHAGEPAPLLVFPPGTPGSTLATLLDAAPGAGVVVLPADLQTGAPAAAAALAPGAGCFQRFFHHFPHLSCQVDPAGVLLAVNPAWCAAVGRRAVDVLGQPLAHFLTEASAARFRDQDLAELWSAGLLETEQELRGPGGSVIQVAASGVVLDRQAGALRALLVQRDVTAEHRAHQQRDRDARRLAEAYTMLGQLYDTSLTGLRAVDLEFRVVNANAAVARMSGREVDQVVQATCHQSFPCERCHQPNCTLERIKRGEQVRGEETLRTRADGSTVPCLVSASPFHDAEGKLQGMVEELIDLSHTRRLESIAASVDLSQSLGYVFAGIRHEIGNPVAAIKMALSVMKTRLEQGKMDQVREYVGHITQELGRVERLLQTLKGFNMSDKPQPVPVQLTRLVDEFLALGRPDLDRRAVKVVRDLDPAADPVLVDPRVLHQALLRLQANALDALEGCEVPVLTVSTRRQDGHSVLTLRDNGRGISREVQEQLFQPFFTTKPKGTGLGLVLVRRMLAAMGCDIRIDSVLTEGTQVHLSLPAAALR